MRQVLLAFIIAYSTTHEQDRKQMVQQPCLRSMRHSLLRQWSRKIQTPFVGRRLLSSSSSSSSTPSNSPAPSAGTSSVEETDVLIVGGGVVGCALAQQLTSRAPSLRIGLVEARGAPKLVDLARTASTVPPNPRSYALSPFSLQLLGLDHPEASPRLGFYDSMQIWEAGQPASLMFSSQDIQADRLGAVVEDSTIVQHLWKQIQNRCVTMDNSMVQSIELPSNTYEKATVAFKTKDGETESKTLVSTNLVVGADGASSAVRRMMGIARTQYEYGHSALTFTVELNGTHGGRAFQRFLKNGPIALLPTFSPNHSIVVWSTTTDDAMHWKNHPDLVDKVNDLLHDGPTHLRPFFGTILSGMSLPTPISNLLYGVDKIIETAQYGPAVAAQELGGRPFLPTPTITKTVSPHFTFPLQTGQVHRYTDARLALIGDAAHTVRPAETNIGCKEGICAITFCD